MDFWRGGEYAYTYGNVHVRTQWGRIWYNRATGSDRAADANLGLHTGGSTTFVHHGWADIRGFGFPLRCATDATAMPTKHPTGYNYFEFKYSIALEAAAAPSELAVTICLKVFARQSPAAKNPEAEVFPSSSALI